jgi:hypothetical protein
MLSGDVADLEESKAEKFNLVIADVNMPDVQSVILVNPFTPGQCPKAIKMLIGLSR